MNRGEGTEYLAGTNSIEKRVPIKAINTHYVVTAVILATIPFAPSESSYQSYQYTSCSNSCITRNYTIRTESTW
jgi:hypothetical protein